MIYERMLPSPKLISGTKTAIIFNSIYITLSLAEGDKKLKKTKFSSNPKS